MLGFGYAQARGTEMADKPKKIMKKCETCNGKGKLTGEIVEGTGKKSIKCPWCQGKGFVFKAPQK